MNEFALIRRYFADAASKATGQSGVALGIGDDCALLDVPSGHQLAVSLDTLVEGVHFPKDMAPQHIASRAFTTALSDLAAMGAKPLWVTLGLTLPQANTAWVQAFSQSFIAMAQRYDCALVGGDTTRGPLTVTVQVHGVVESTKAIRRSGANIGDTLYVTGSLGDGAASLALLQNRLTVDDAAQQYLKNNFYEPSPRINEGLLLAGIASAAIDISDGLYADLEHVCAASQVGAKLHLERIPCSDHWRSRVSQEQARQWIMAGGDDYELCFTVPPDHTYQIDDWIQSSTLCATAIGEICASEGILLYDNRHLVTIDCQGYQHF